MPLSEATSLSLSDTCFDCGSGSSSVIRSQHSFVRMEVKSHLSEVEALCPVLQCKMWTVKERTPTQTKGSDPAVRAGHKASLCSWPRRAHWLKHRELLKLQHSILIFVNT